MFPAWRGFYQYFVVTTVEILEWNHSACLGLVLVETEPTGLDIGACPGQQSLSLMKLSVQTEFLTLP